MPKPDLLVGAHMSIAGGLHRAVERGLEAGCRVIQIFTRNSNQWRAKPLGDEEVEQFRRAREASGLAAVLAHDGYLVNLASPLPDVHRKSLAALEDEMRRAERLGLPGLVVHPGAHLGSGEREGLRRIAASLDLLHRRLPGLRLKILLETTAGQGTSLGFRFQHLARIIEQVEEGDRLAVCLDTCHVFAAGHDLRTAEGYELMIEEFRSEVGIERLAAVHINDSKKDLGSRVDRHEHIGQGKIGREGFRCLMRDERLRRVPKILETPKGPDLEEDRMNLALLRRLAATRRSLPALGQPGRPPGR